MEDFFRELLIIPFPDRAVFFIGIILLLIAQEIVVSIAQARIKSEHRAATEKLTDPREIEAASLEYNGKRQRIAVFRVIAYFLAVLATAIYFDYRAGASLALVAGAIVVALKETIVSAFTYFYVLAHYKIGDDIRVGDNYGEIIAIQPTRTTLLAKDTDGEFTGKVVEIQNYHFAILPVGKQEAKVDTHRLVRLTVPLLEDSPSIEFESFIEKLKAHLDTLLPMRNIRNVGHFRSLAGVRYKLDYDYNTDKGHLLVHITFVSHPSHVGKRKEEIISFVEALRHGKTPKPIKESKPAQKNLDKKKFA